ncbi:histidine kinase [Mucilaginibacter sp. KACC 22773]|uniref:sensor histidine kinase n=1 Tax=Mucilaginibacter sp. KACC 22773 TaxID=3025671 RepID=UPI00236682D3|nr:ATP-binding protein [Mucilaginibacter sp. KACC 22773]WDF79342.1 histidine kinase [Mucilaginibacter sp. KACC 22773]
MKRKSLILFILLTIFQTAGRCQRSNLIHVPILPTDETSRLLVSRIGAIWIGHSAGLTRYDGSNIKDFDSGETAAFNSMVWGLAEDSLQRIWCIMRNSIWCVKNEKLVLVKKIDHVALLKLLSFKGFMFLSTSESLFVFDIKTFSYREYKHQNRGILDNETNIFTIGQDLFITGRYSRKVYRFEETSGFSEVQLLGFSFNNSHEINVSYFQNKAGDPVTTVIKDESKLNPDQFICQLKYFNGILYLSNILNYYGSRIVGVRTFSTGEQWVSSYDEIASNKGEVKKGMGIVDVVVDNEGNKWFLAPGKGLYFEPKKYSINTVGFKNEQITSIAKQVPNLLVGTSSGAIYRYDPALKLKIQIHHAPGLNRGISFIQAIDSVKFIFGSYNGLYLYNSKKEIQFPGPFISKFEGAFKIGDHLYVADGHNPIILDQNGSSLNQSQLNPTERELIKYRLNAVALDSINNVFFLAKRNDLVKYVNGHEERIVFNNVKIIASALIYTDQKLYIVSRKDGLLVLKNNVVSQLLDRSALPPHFITKIKKIEHTLYLLDNEVMRLLDTRTDEPIGNTISYTKNVNDVEVLNRIAYVICDNKLLFNKTNSDVPDNKLVCSELSTVINDSDTTNDNNLILPYNKNSLSVNLSFPVFNNPEMSFYRYRLTCDQQGNWEATKPGESTLHFLSLKPGKYQLMIKAIHPILGESTNYIVKNFLILDPWWQTWIFKVALTLFFLILLLTASRAYHISKLKEQKAFFEKELALEKERQNISREIHDDIGQSLSVIKLNLNMGAPAQLEEAKSILSDVIKDLREFTHNLYYGKFLMDDLVTTIKKDIDSLNNTNQIKVNLEMQWHDCKLTGQIESLVYRIFQEAVNNIIKHAHAKNISVSINGNIKELILIIKDDGLGFDLQRKKNGLGLNNMRQRAKLAGGMLLINSSPDKGCEIKLSLPL